MADDDTTVVETDDQTTDEAKIETPISHDSEGKWPANWRDEFAGGDKTKASQFERYTSPADVGKAFLSQRERISSGDLLKPLPDGATDDDVKAYREQQGIPGEVSGYFENMPDGLVIGDDDKAVFESLAGSLHDINASPGVVHQTIKWYNNYVEEQAAIQQEGDVAARQKTEDDSFQVIPTQWIQYAQKRWLDQPQPPTGVPMCAIGCDIAQGGADQTILAVRHDGWFAELIKIAGVETPDGPSVAGRILAIRRHDAAVVVDMGGGYGGSCYDHLKANQITCIAFKGAEKSMRRTVDKTLKFTNKRSEVYWRFREALDPSQYQGSPICLPNDPELIADLTAPKFEVTPNGIKITTKKDLIKLLGRSPDAGDAVVMAWYSGPTAKTHITEWRQDQGTALGLGRRAKAPVVNLGKHYKTRRRA